MDFGIGEDAVALVAAIGEFFDRRGDGRAIADAVDGGSSRDRWEALCGIGIPTLRLPEPLGVGACLLDSAAVAECFGAVLLPEPASTSIVIARALVAHNASERTVEAVLDGSRVVGLAVRHDEDRIRIADDGVTNLIAVPVDSGLALVDRAVLGATAERSDIDPSRPTALCHAGHDGAVETVQMTSDDVATVTHEWAVLTVSELVGGMAAILSATIEFAKRREQFGRSIGSFQAVKHQLADMFVAVEQARAAVQFAAISCDDSAATADADVAAAARWVPASAIGLFERAIHLHGAMGYAWEGGVHLHLRRAVATRTLLRESRVTQPQAIDVDERAAS